MFATTAEGIKQAKDYLISVDKLGKFYRYSEWLEGPVLSYYANHLKRNSEDTFFEDAFKNFKREET